MALEAPFPDLEELINTVGEAGHRLSDIDSSEGAAGNISVYIGWPIDPRRRFPLTETITLPEPQPDLAHRTFLVTGSGRRLREVLENPLGNLGIVVVNDGGETGTLYTAPARLFARVTSEFNSHLAIHRDQIIATGTNFHAVIHAQPMHLTYLSHIPRYQDETYLNRHILRWEPEMIVHIPEGVGHIPFILPGSLELGRATVEALRNHKVVLWGKHGVVARSDLSPKRACDLIEYVETGARYEYLNLANNEQGEGLSVDQIRAIAAAFNVKQSVF